MRRLSLLASEVEAGQEVISINDKDFNTPSSVMNVYWERDNPVLCLFMDGGLVSLILTSNTLVDVVHPEQYPVYEMEEWYH